MHNSADTDFYSYGMGTRSSSSRAVLAASLRALMDKRGWTQVEVKKAGGPSQRHVSSLLNKQQNCSTKVLEQLGDAFGIPGWLLLIPNLPIDLLDSQDIPLLIQHYVEAGQNGKDLVSRMAEREAHHNRLTPPPLLSFPKGKRA